MKIQILKFRFNLDIVLFLPPFPGLLPGFCKKELILTLE